MTKKTHRARRGFKWLSWVVVLGVLTLLYLALSLHGIVSSEVYMFGDDFRFRLVQHAANPWLYWIVMALNVLLSVGCCSLLIGALRNKDEPWSDS